MLILIAAERLRALFLNHSIIRHKLFLNHLIIRHTQVYCDTAVSGAGSSLALATCDTSQVLLAGVPGGFSRGSPVFLSVAWPTGVQLVFFFC